MGMQRGDAALLPAATPRAQPVPGCHQGLPSMPDCKGMTKPKPLCPSQKEMVALPALSLQISGVMLKSHKSGKKMSPNS